MLPACECAWMGSAEHEIEDTKLHGITAILSDESSGRRDFLHFRSFRTPARTSSVTSSLSSLAQGKEVGLSRFLHPRWTNTLRDNHK